MSVQFGLSGDCDCAVCGRWVYADGPSLVIEQAVGDEESQADSHLSELAHSTNKEKRLRFEDIAVRFEAYSVYGYLEPKRELRHLEDHTSEIKTSRDRVLFYEVAATSTHKRAVRVTNCCEKRIAKTAQGKLPRKHIRKAQAIERKDRSHDTH